MLSLIVRDAMKQKPIPQVFIFIDSNESNFQVFPKDDSLLTPITMNKKSLEELTMLLFFPFVVSLHI